MKTILLTAALAISSGIFAQTKLIAHRSHSGSLATFSVDANCNLGLGPMERYYELEEIEEKDSVSVDSLTLKKIETQPNVPSQIKKNGSPSVRSEKPNNERTLEKKVCPLPTESSSAKAAGGTQKKVSSEKLKTEEPAKNQEKKAVKEKVKSSKQESKAGINPLAVIFLLSIIVGPALIYIFKAQRNRQ